MSGIEYPSNSSDQEKYDYDTLAAKHIQLLATTVSRTVHQMITNDNHSNHVSADISLVNSLVLTYVFKKKIF